MPSALLTNDLCSRKPTAPVKYFDTKLAGLYAYISLTGACSFSYKFYDEDAKAQRTVPVGKFDRKSFDIDAARKQAKILSGKIADGVITTESRRQQTVSDVLTFDQAADEYIAWLKIENKLLDGVKVARKESWRNDVSNLTRPSAAFGKKLVSKIDNTIVQNLLTGIIDEGYAPLSINVRVTLHSMFKWLCSPAGGKRLIVNPCHNLNQRPKQNRKTRFLSRDELNLFWNALDRNDLPCERRVALTYKLILATMLRPGEVLAIRRSWIKVYTDEEGGDGRIAVRIPAAYVKKRRVIIQPLNKAAQEIVAELMAMPTKGDMLIPPGGRGGELAISDLATALRGRTPPKVRKSVKVATQRTVGLCELLGMAKFTAHDLRRTSSTQLGLGWKEHGFAKTARSDTGRCLDHQPEDAAGTTVIYDVSEQVEQTELRRETLEHLDGLLRAIVGRPATSKVVRLKVAA